MNTKVREKALNKRALKLANRGIHHGACQHYATAVRHWQLASAFADRYLPGRDIDYWIKSGYGAALFDVAEYEQSIVVSELARAWCRGIGQPLPSLTMARAYLQMGDSSRAEPYLTETHALIGDTMYEHFSPSDQATVRALLDRRIRSGNGDA